MSRQEERIISLLEEIRDELEDLNSDSDTSGDSYECGVGGCSRTVNSAEETCWQHEPEE